MKSKAQKTSSKLRAEATNRLGIELTLREKLYLLLLWCVTILALLVALSITSYAQEQPRSELPAQSPKQVNIEQLAKEATEWRETLRRALDKIEAQQEQIAKGEELIERQKEIIEAHTRLQQIQHQESEALRRAFDAKTQVADIQRERAELAEKRVTELEAKLASARKRNKVWAVVGFVLGIAAKHAL